nr:MAG TPA: hypothetical protein [Caudoviricetes sp.]
MLDLVLVGLLLLGVVACCGALAVLQVLINSFPRKGSPRFYSTLERNMYLIDKGYLKSND